MERRVREGEERDVVGLGGAHVWPKLPIAVLNVHGAYTDASLGKHREEVSAVHAHAAPPGERVVIG
jgi:hypothetical protein